MQGGQVTTRGIVFQIFVGIMDALENEDWETISVEPNNEGDKVDIVCNLYEGSKKIKKVTQVKTTSEKFDTGEVGKWLIELVDTTTADRYELRLIGSMTYSTFEFLRKLENNLSFTTSTEKRFKSLKSYSQKIKIINSPLNDSIFMSSIVGLLYKFISSQSIDYSYYVLDFAANALLGDMGILSTKGEMISKTDYINKILKWLTLCKEKSISQKELYAKKLYEDVINLVESKTNLNQWNTWTNLLLVDPPSIKKTQLDNIYELKDELETINWPEEYKNISFENSVKLLVHNLYNAMNLFSRLSYHDDNNYIKVSKKHEILPGLTPCEYKSYKNSYGDWHGDVIDRVKESTKAANWFITNVKNDFFPNYMQSKFVYLGFYEKHAFKYGKRTINILKEANIKIVDISDNYKYL